MSLLVLCMIAQSCVHLQAIEQQFPKCEFKTFPPFKLIETPGSVKLFVDEKKCTVAMVPKLPVVSIITNPYKSAYLL